MDKKSYWKHCVSTKIKFCIYSGIIVGYALVGYNILSLMGVISYRRPTDIYGRVYILFWLVPILGLTLGIHLAKSRVCSTILGVIYTLIAFFICVSMIDTISYFPIDKFGSLYLFIGLLIVCAVCFDLCAVGTYLFHSKYKKDVKMGMVPNMYGQNQFRQGMYNQNMYGQNQYRQPNNNQNMYRHNSKV